MRSLNQYIKLIQTLKQNHGQLSDGTFYFGDPWEFMQTSPDINGWRYPFFGLRLISSNVNGKLHTTNFNLYFADLVSKDESNETEVLSDMERIALDIYSQIGYELENNVPGVTQPATIELSSGITPFTERWNDEVAGVEMNITLTQFFDRQTCDIPD
jgi:hypothetical protein